MSFIESTHAKHWLFTQAQLVEQRQTAYNASVSSLKPGADPLTPQEIALLLRYYERFIQNICKNISLPEKCQVCYCGALIMMGCVVN